MPKRYAVFTSLGNNNTTCHICGKYFEGDKRTVKQQLKLHDKKVHDGMPSNLKEIKLTKSFTTNIRKQNKDVNTMKPKIYTSFDEKDL